MGRRQADQPRKLNLELQWTTSGDERAQHTEIFKKLSQIVCNFLDTLDAPGVHSSLSTSINTTKMNCRFQARSTDYSLKSMEVAAQGILKHLRPKGIISHSIVGEQICPKMSKLHHVFLR